MGTYEPLVEYLTREKTFSAEELAAAKRSILDCSAVIIAGTRENPLPNLLQIPYRGAGKSSILGYGGGYSAQDAALYNGIASHILDLDDCSASFWGHPTVVTLPALYALGEQLNSSGEEIVNAYLAGLEAICKLGVCYGANVHATGWHATGVFGSLSAACACGVLLGFDKQQFQYVIGAAASLSCGLRANFGTSTKALHVGIACQNGLLAALMVQKGLTSSINALDGAEGFIQLFTGEPCSEEKTARLQQILTETYAINDPGFVLKAYPSCSSNHQATEALLKILDKHPIHAEDVEKIDAYVSISVLRELVTPDPKTEVEARFSPGFHFGLLLNGMPIVPASFRMEKINLPEVQRIIKATTLIHYPAYDSIPGVDVWPARVKVTLKDGTVYEEECWYPSGHPKNDFSPQRMKEKVSNCCVPVIGEEKTERFYEALSDLEHAASIRDIIAITL